MKEIERREVTKKRREGGPDQPGQDVRKGCEENRRSERT